MGTPVPVEEKCKTSASFAAGCDLVRRYVASGFHAPDQVDAVEGLASSLDLHLNDGFCSCKYTVAILKSN